MSDSREKRAIRSVLRSYASRFGLEPSYRASGSDRTSRSLVLSPFELAGFLDVPLATHLSLMKNNVRNELSTFTDYSFTFGDGYCSARSMFSQKFKDRIRTRDCRLDLLQGGRDFHPGWTVQVLFRESAVVFLPWNCYW